MCGLKRVNLHTAVKIPRAALGRLHSLLSCKNRKASLIWLNKINGNKATAWTKNTMAATSVGKSRSTFAFAVAFALCSSFNVCGNCESSCVWKVSQVEPGKAKEEWKWTKRYLKVTTTSLLYNKGFKHKIQQHKKALKWLQVAFKIFIWLI